MQSSPKKAHAEATFYACCSPKFRRDVHRLAVAQQDEALHSVLSTAQPVAIRSLRAIGALIHRSGCAFVRFWNIPVLGPSDQRGWR
jgi:hypothetical protein